MERRRGPLGGLLGSMAAAATLAVVGFFEGSSSHSMQYFATRFSEPVQGLPQYIEIGYVDGQLFSHYDSNTKKVLPRVSWVKEVDKEDPQYWDRNTLTVQRNELISQSHINTLMKLYNHTGGLHIYHWMYGCELRGDGSKGGYNQHGYDGKDYIAFDKETLTWTAADAQAQMRKGKWDANRAYNEHQKFYLDKECIEWLQNHLRYGNKTLLRKEPPKMKVTSRPDYDNMETLICRADGFYPKDIEVVWTRDGEVWEEEMRHGFVAPNSDGTYHTWISIKVNPEDKNRFRCRVDHASLEDPVDFVEEKPASWLLICLLILVVLLVVGILAFLFWKKRQEGYRAASTNEGGISLHGQASPVVSA